MTVSGDLKRGCSPMSWCSDTDLLTAPADRISHAKVLRTIVNGTSRFVDSAG